MAGTIYRHGDHWDVRLSLPGGKKSRPVHLPPDIDEEQARAAAHAMHERAREQHRAARAVAPAQSCDAYAERLWTWRRAHGYTSVRQDESRWRTWASPILGAMNVAAVTGDDAELVVRALDAAIRAKKILPKTASLAWGVVTSLFAETCESKEPDLKVRKRGDNPTKGIRGPDTDAGRVCGWIYPVEALTLLRAARVPLRWRRLFALAIYSYLRPGELEALEPAAVDLLGGTFVIHQAADRSKERGARKKTKTRMVRRVPIEPALLPLVEALLRDARRAGRKTLVTMPPVSDLAEGLRTYLRRAGVEREELFADDESRRPIRFYDLRATGITWRALRGDLPLAIQAAAGHTSFETTQGYIRAAADIGAGVGVPFPVLPAELLSLDSGADSAQVPGLRSTYEMSGSEVASPAGFEPTQNGADPTTAAPNPRIGTPFGGMDGAAARALSGRLSGVRTNVLAAMARYLEAFDAGDVDGTRGAGLELLKLAAADGPRQRGAPRYVTDPRTGRSQTVSAWARELGHTSQGLTWRLDNMPVERALARKDRAA